MAQRGPLAREKRVEERAVQRAVAELPHPRGRHDTKATGCGRLRRVRRLALILALLASCGPPAAVGVTGSPTPSAAPSVVEVPSPASSRSPAPEFRDLKITPAGDVRGDHALVLQVSSPPGGFPSTLIVWDVPLDGSGPRQLVSYERASGPLADFDSLALSRQLSPDGRRLVLSDPVDVAGAGLVVVDLVMGTARRIPLEGITNQPAWSPDGERIAYRGATMAGALQKDTGVWVVSAAGAGARQLVPSELAAGAGATTVYGWTEDGKGVIFSMRLDALFSADAASGAVTRIGGPTNGLSPVASRAARPSVAIVFNDQGAPGQLVGHVEVRDSAAASGRTVARYGPAEGTFLMEPRWRPGSDEILLFYASGEGVAERDELVIVDGITGARRTIQTPSFVRSAGWSADGKRVLYASLAEVRTADADGSNDRALFRPQAPRLNEQALVIGVAAFAPR